MSWDQLHSILKEAAVEREYWATTPPSACPVCGEPLLSGPPDSDRILYCPWGDYSYPRDHVRPQAL